MVDENCFTESKSEVYGFEDFDLPESFESEIEQYDLTYKKGETILKQGTIVPHVAFVKSGMVKIVLEFGNRKQPWGSENKGFIGLESM